MAFLCLLGKRFLKISLPALFSFICVLFFKQSSKCSFFEIVFKRKASRKGKPWVTKGRKALVPYKYFTVVGLPKEEWLENYPILEVFESRVFYLSV